jgi:hypothetical protein
LSLNGNGNNKRVLLGGIATVLAALSIFLITSVIHNTNRITAVETEINGIKSALALNREEVKQNRDENREEHQIINQKLDSIIREMKK